MAPSFLTDNKNNVSYFDKKEGSIYGTGAQDERRDIKFNLPKIKFIHDHKVRAANSYHVVGKLIKDRSIINEKVTSMQLNETVKKERVPLGIATESQRLEKVKC
jgi:hypothetical protein